MSGASLSPHALTSGAGYIPPSVPLDSYLRRHSNFYRRHSTASAVLDEDRRRSSTLQDMNAHIAEARRNHDATQNDAEGGSGPVENAGKQQQQQQRKQSVSVPGAATATMRKGSVVVESVAERKDSIFGLEATAGRVQGVEGEVGERRGSTSLAHDVFRKLRKGSK